MHLPWKQDHPLLPDNFTFAQRRLQGLNSRLQGNHNLLEEYDSIIKDQEWKGIIERVTSSKDIEVGKTHYLSHHPVICQDKDTTKVRIVYNASAKNSSGTSLNSCLYTGPYLLKTVAEILARFRLYPIAFTADIEKAFLMIGIHPSDCDVLRFLWYEDAMPETPEVICYRFCRVVFGVGSIPFLLNVTLVQHIEDYLEDFYEVCTKLLNSLHADDMDSGGHSVNEVLELYQTSKQIMAKGGFNLRKWLSNSKEVMMRIAELEGQSLKSEEVVQTQSTIHEDDQSFTKTTLEDSKQDTNTNELLVVLGLTWDPDTDMFVFRFVPLEEMASQLPPTKRSVLKIIARIFDPLGLITPITKPLKVFLQKSFKSASKKLIALFKSAKVQAYLTEKRIKWKYNLAKEPWWGGFYERLVKSVKSCLKKCVGRASLSFDELHTTPVEIEGVLNSRPVTYLYSDDLEEPLTPSHLILGRRILKLPEFEEDEEDDKDFDDNPDTALRRLRYFSNVLKHYWQRWKAEYLVDLREFHKMRKGQKGLPVDIKEGDIVSVQDEGRRNQILWKLSRVAKLIK